MLTLTNKLIEGETMTTEQKIIYLLQYHEQLVKEFTSTCFDMDEDNQEYSAYLKAKLHKVNDLIDEYMLQVECMPF